MVRAAVAGATLLLLFAGAAAADPSPRPLPFAEDWTSTGLLFADDEWGAIRAVMGFRGDGLASGEGIDPRLVLVDGSTTPIDVTVDQRNPDTLVIGGVAEFELANPTVALQGSGVAAAPHLVLYLNTSGESGVRVSYRLRDLDGSADDAVQPVAMQFRVGTLGAFQNLPAGYVADATTGGSATRETQVTSTLPAAADGQREVQVRVITGNARGADEWVGVDEIRVDAGGPTSIGVHALSARRTGMGVLVRWRAELGSDALQFDIYRERGGGRVRVNPVTIRNLAGDGRGGRRYGFLDRTAPSRPARYWLRSVRSSGLRTWHGPVSTR